MADLVTVGAAAPEDAQTELERLGLAASRWSAGPGAWFGGHAHHAPKVLFCVEGEIVFTVGGERWPLRPGDRLDLPAGTWHEAQVGADGVTCVEAYRTDHR